MAFINPDGSALISPEPGSANAGWTLNAAPAANTQATATRAAGGAGVRHVCTSILAILASTTGLAANATGTFVLRDGASGTGTIIWQGQISIPNAVGQSQWVSIDSINIVGSYGTAMTAEFTAASGAGTLQSLSITGYDTN